MAKNEAKIKFTAETSDFSQAIKEANSEMSTLRAEMKLNEAQFQNTGNEAEYFQQKSELLEAQLASNADKQEALTQKLQAAKEIYGEDSEEVAKLERQLIYAKTEEEKLKAQLDITNQGLHEQTSSAGEAGNSVESMADILVSAGIASAIKEIADTAFELAAAFDEANAAIVEGTGASGEALEGLNLSAQGALTRIADSGQDISGVSEILAELNTRFGVTGTEAEDLTVKMANFAHHTGIDGVAAVDEMANVMNRWGLDMDDVDGLLDDLTAANQSCQLSVGELTSYLSDNSIQFSELGYSTEDALAMLISLSDGGANVSTVMMGMKKAVGTLSETTNDVPGAFQDTIDAIAECDTVAEALQAQVGNTGMTVEEVFGSRAAQELAGNIQSGNFNIEKWTELLNENEGALETTTENATTMSDAWAMATNSVSVALSSSLTPAISDVVIKISEIITTVSRVIQQSPALKAVIVGVATALTILGGALAISAAIQAVQKAFALLNTTMLMNPIFLVVTAIAALVAALVYAYNHSEKFREICDKVWNAIKTVVVTVVNIIKNVITKVFNAIKTVITTYVNVYKTIITTVWNAIKTTTTAVWNAVKTAITTPINTAKNIVTKVFNSIRNTVRSTVSSVRSTVSSGFSAVKNLITRPFETAKNTLTRIVNSIKRLFPVRFGKILNFSLPSINVSKGKAPWGIGGAGEKPKFSVSWAQHAAGGIFSRPTLIPTIRANHVVGEAGPEAIAPISVLQQYIADAVQRNIPQQIDYDAIGDRVAKACSRMNIEMKINNREFGRIIRETM